MNNTALKLLDLSEVKLLVGGRWENAYSGETYELKNPSNGQKIADIPYGGHQETANAINEAEKVLEGWSKLTAYERAEYLLILRDLLFENEKELAELMSLEMGKAYKESLGEIKYAASFLTWYAEEGKRIYGETIPASAQNKRLFVIKQPVGVVAAITPWNFPLAMMTRKLGPALAAGCTSIVKPASQSPLTALAFGKLVEQSGIPRGVVSILTGNTGEISNEIFENPIVKKVSFTGSTSVGKALVKSSASQLKKLSLELGGHAPFLIFEDADLEKAAEGALASKFRNAGQTCVCANRIYVHENVKDKFAEIFTEKVEKLVVGDSLQEQTDIGPLVNEAGLNKVVEHVEDAVKKGAKVLCGGKRKGASGYYYYPTVVDEIKDEMLIMNEETFGPVAPISTFSDTDEVIKRANNTEYGLAAYLYTNDIKQAVYVSERINFGVVGLNDAMPGTAQAPFGGMKESGYGREGGKEGIQEYLEEKYISLDL
ncbi:NAD-dependent succinate-semialdehyde dehydrogenase [Oceanobacillus oncorhynchi subsp. incaldanensis]|uniref:NAD-dependent succinate-semialdehyde dehydrogenase n=1 Tax=Oceanobacillus oncorhynchi TaxID=545501 RepID=UPI001B267337|nr:NAD-dependent succinate-semialdehyde dehydrogenase [Oceanobacillus oncorhynchi]GIO20349.1 NAD-dependent succinate-semialdehyde dehydrogenase [Oceanobacillus oncorhynchi subsp. incaldanensis]